MRNVNDVYRPSSEGRRPLPYEFDREALARQLEKVVSGEVRFDAGSRAMYSTDASNYRQVPIGVVIPKNIDDILQTVEVARRFGVSSATVRRLEAQLDGATSGEVAALRAGEINLAMHAVIARHVDADPEADRAHQRADTDRGEDDEPELELDRAHAVERSQGSTA